MVKLQSLIDANDEKYDYSQFKQHVKGDCPTHNKIFGGMRSIEKFMQTFHSNNANNQ